MLVMMKKLWRSRRSDIKNDYPGESSKIKNNDNTVLNVSNTNDNPNKIVVEADKDLVGKVFDSLIKEIVPNFGTGIAAAAAVKGVSSMNVPPVQKVGLMIAAAAGVAQPAAASEGGRQLGKGLENNNILTDKLSKGSWRSDASDFRW